MLVVVERCVHDDCAVFECCCGATGGRFICDGYERSIFACASIRWGPEAMIVVVDLGSVRRATVRSAPWTGRAIEVGGTEVIATHGIRWKV